MSSGDFPRNVMLVGPNSAAVAHAITHDHSTWSVATASGYADAIRNISDEFDAVVIDAEIGYTESRALLDEASVVQPNLARVLTDGDSIMRSHSRNAHEVVDLKKGVLEMCRAVERTSKVQMRLHDRRLLEFLDTLDGLPSPPTYLVKLCKLLEEDTVEVSEVGSLIETDVAMTARVLQLVNSAAFGLSQKVDDVERAISLIGLNVVANLVSGLQLVDSLSSSSDGMRSEFNAINAHSIRVAERARSLSDLDSAYVGGLLHDVGLMALLAGAPNAYVALRETDSSATADEFEMHEIDVVGSTHATIGAWLLQSWNLPWPVVEAVARSHDGDSWEVTSLQTRAVYAAEQLVSSEDRKWWEPGFDVSYEPSDFK